MLPVRTLLVLAERFGLRSHVETREFSGYELVVAKGGARLDAPAPGFPELPPDRPGMISRQTAQNGWLLVRLRARKQAMPAFAEWLVSDSRPVLDKTGLAGRYDFTLEFARELPGANAAVPTEPPAPDLFTALRRQLGLQLVPRKIPLPVVVVESLNRVPTPN